MSYCTFFCLQTECTFNSLLFCSYITFFNSLYFRMTDTCTSVLDMPAHTEEENNSKVALNRFQFLFENPFLLQDLLSREKLIMPDHLDIDWVLHPDRPVVQTVSLIRLQRSYLAARFHVRITSESRVLAMSSNLVFPYNSSNSVDLNNLSDSDAIPQVVEEFLTLSEDRFMLLFHHSESSWEMIGCLSPMPFIKVSYYIYILRFLS